MNIIDKAIDFAKKEYQKNDKHHSWNHIMDVFDRARLISQNYQNIDTELLDLAIIFHDIDYHSESTPELNYTNHVDNSVEVAKKFLETNQYPNDRLNKVIEIMLDHSRPHREVRGDASSIEGEVIFDADKSIFISTQESYDRYINLLYLPETKTIVNHTMKKTL
jgi:HD superfamily phosphodiesterase